MNEKPDLITIQIEGRPIPLQRARGTRSHFYDPQYIAKKNFALEVKSQFNKSPISEKIFIFLSFEFKIPESWSKKKKARMVNQPHAQTPDLSNLVKFTEDALNGIVWKDDALICSIHTCKKWSLQDMTTIIIDATKD